MRYAAGIAIALAAIVAHAVVFADDSVAADHVGLTNDGTPSSIDAAHESTVSPSSATESEYRQRIDEAIDAEAHYEHGQMDKDKDGFVTLSEMNDHYVTQYKAWAASSTTEMYDGPKTDADIEKAAKEETEYAFERMDVDKDGLVSVLEMTALYHTDAAESDQYSLVDDEALADEYDHDHFHDDEHEEHDAPAGDHDDMTAAELAETQHHHSADDDIPTVHIDQHDEL